VTECGDPVSFGSPRFTTVDAGAFLVTHAWFPPAAFLPRHFHDRTVVGVTVGGRGNSILGSREIGLEAGTLHTEPAGDSHSNRFASSGARLVVVQPDPAAEVVLGPLLTEIHRVVQAQPAALARRIRAEIAEPDPLSTLAIEGACYELLAVGARAIAPARTTEHDSGDWLQDVIDYLHAHVLDCPTMARLSEVAGMAPAEFPRAFRRALRQSPAAYLRGLRLNWAADALARTDCSMADVVAASGLGDRRQFTRAFRRHTGTTPTAYRRLGVDRHARRRQPRDLPDQ
jgi:AraC-like DNA-binding protein/quercetin dioxygenase-like cupin family protein